MERSIEKVTEELVMVDTLDHYRLPAALEIEDGNYYQSWLNKNKNEQNIDTHQRS